MLCAAHQSVALRVRRLFSPLLLALAGLATAWLYRRWSRWPAYLICTPVILLLVLLIFDSFSGLLPATL